MLINALVPTLCLGILVIIKKIQKTKRPQDGQKKGMKIKEHKQSLLITIVLLPLPSS